MIEVAFLIAILKEFHDTPGPRLMWIHFVRTSEYLCMGIQKLTFDKTYIRVFDRFLGKEKCLSFFIPNSL